jgi:CHAT domain-containing protein
MALRFILLWYLATTAVADSTLTLRDDGVAPWIEYKKLVQDVSKVSIDDQIFNLKRFLIQYPHFENVYLKILNTFILQDKLTEAKIFFQNLASERNTSCFSEWMLAKISMVDNEKSTVERHFRRALVDNNFSIRMIFDIVQYYPDRTIVQRLLKDKMIYTDERSLILAMMQHRIRNYNAAGRLFESIERKDNYGLLVYQLYGDSYFNAYRLQDADSVWNIGLHKSQQSKDEDSEAEFLNSLGNLYNARLQFKLAFSFFSRSDSIALCMGNARVIQLNAAGRASTEYNLDRYENALKLYKRAIKIAQESMDDSRLADWYKYKGWTCLQLNKFTETISAYDTSELFARKKDDYQNIVDVILSKAELFDFLDQNEIALEQLKLALGIADYYKFVRLKMEIEAEIEKIKVKKGYYKMAKRQYLRYIRYLEIRNLIIEQANMITQLAEVCRLEGNYDQAKIYIQRAVDLFGKSQSPVYQAWYKLPLADLEAVDGHFQQALRIRQEVDSMARAFNRPDLLVDVQIGIGDDYSRLGDDQQSTGAYRKAAQIIENTRESITIEQLRMGYFSRFSDTYRKLVGCYGRMALVDPQNTAIDSILSFFLSGRERISQDQMMERIPSGRSIQSWTDSSYLQACSQLQAIQRDAKEAIFRQFPVDSFKYLQARIEAARYSVLGQRLRMNPKSYSPPKQLVPKNQALIHLMGMIGREDASLLLIHVSDETSYALAFNEKDTALVPLKTTPKILTQAVDSLVGPFHQLEKGSINNVPFRADLAFKLYQTLIQPVESILKKSKTIIVLPDDVVLNLPLEMLLDAKPAKSIYTPLDSPDYADAFLLNRYIFQYSPMLRPGEDRSVLFRQHPRMCVFANPNRSVISDERSQLLLRSPAFGRFDPLPFAELEAEQIRQVNRNVHSFVRDQATEMRLDEESKKADILHFATHAFFDSSFDAFSGLALAETSDTTDDGLLMGYEIADMNLDCDLVTLSACETGRGKRMAGEGILGLPRTFLGAGARTVLMTLWKVDDRFTSMIMPVFYDRYLNMGLTKAEALAEAKRSFFYKRGLKPSGLQSRDHGRVTATFGLRHAGTDHITDYRHPFFWASFMLFGEQGDRARWGGGFSALLIGVLLVAGLGSAILLIAVRKGNLRRRQGIE